MATTSLERFVAAVSRPDDDINLAEAALLVALDEYPDLDVAAYLRRLDDMAASIRDRLSPSPPVVDVLGAINRYLFVDQGFEGNSENFGDPRNSYLNDVLDRRLGIPISLSVIYLELGWRLDLPLEGVSFPGHFLVKCTLDGGFAVLDPFYAGASLGEDDLLLRLRTIAGGGEVDQEQLAPLLAGAPRRAILLRILRNLKGIFLEGRGFERALPVCERIARVAPDEACEVRDHARVFEALECFRPALAGYRRYLALAPGADDAFDVHGKVTELQERVAQIS